MLEAKRWQEGGKGARVQLEERREGGAGESWDKDNKRGRDENQEVDQRCPKITPSYFVSACPARKSNLHHLTMSKRQTPLLLSMCKSKTSFKSPHFTRQSKIT